MRYHGISMKNCITQPGTKLYRRNVFFSYDDDGPMILKDISCKIGLASRVGIVGANGAGVLLHRSGTGGSELWIAPGVYNQQNHQ